jgi:glycine/D-amino acid oxidase-like deaminating enzyme
LKDGRVHEVVTDKGTIQTEIVVNAAGQWGREVGMMVGLSLPVVPMAHLYLITKPIEGVKHDFPTLRDPDLLVYWREEVGGLVTGGYERNPAPFGLNGIPRDFKYQLLPPDWRLLIDGESIKRAAVESAEVIKLLNGPRHTGRRFARDAVKGFWWHAFRPRPGAGGIGAMVSGSSMDTQNGTSGGWTCGASVPTTTAWTT